MKNRFTLGIIIAVLTAGGLVYLFQDRLGGVFGGQTGTSPRPGIQSARSGPDVSVVAQDLRVPWEMAFLPGGDWLVTERPGTLKRIGANRQTHVVQGVVQTSEGGLLGLALHPRFDQNDWLYLYLTSRSGEGLVNRIERYRYDNDELTDRKLILGDIPGAANHDGGRLAFGPDGYLYATTGDAGNEMAAQDTASLAGKILRLNDEGGVPPDNPFGNFVYSYGHRNSQGLAWDNQDRLWSSEHGRSGLRSGFDELNLISKGANYGWPLIEGDETRQGMRRPVIHSGADETWAPAGLVYRNGSLFFGGLRGQSLYQAKITGQASVELKAHFSGQFGRLRLSAVGPDGRLYISTSNTDGRGRPNPGDDKIIRLNLTLF